MVKGLERVAAARHAQLAEKFSRLLSEGRDHLRRPLDGRQTVGAMD
jgi:hypothetical protein